MVVFQIFALIRKFNQALGYENIYFWVFFWSIWIWFSTSIPFMVTSRKSITFDFHAVKLPSLGLQIFQISCISRSTKMNFMSQKLMDSQSEIKIQSLSPHEIVLVIPTSKEKAISVTSFWHAKSHVFISGTYFTSRRFLSNTSKRKLFFYFYFFLFLIILLMTPNNNKKKKRMKTAKGNDSKLPSKKSFVRERREKEGKKACLISIIDWFFPPRLRKSHNLRKL